ncbi:MAG: EAL domain-containing protein [Methylococcus sp.]|nr:EAL domain-containing protein [Methylococcus sp.]
MIIPSFYLFSGICIYAFFTHLEAARNSTKNKKELIFSCMCLLVALIAILHVRCLQATSLNDYIWPSKAFIALAIIFFLCTVWFITIYTKQRHAYFAYALSLTFIILFAVNLFSPFSLEYAEITEIKTMKTPWGEPYIRAEGQLSPWMETTYPILFLTYGYMFISIAKFHKKTRKNEALWMLIAMIVFFISTIHGMLARVSIVDAAPMGPLGFIALVILMNRILNHENYQQLKLANLVFNSTSEGMLLTNQEATIIAVNPAFTDTTGYSAEEVVGKKANVLSSGRQDRAFYTAMWNSIKTTGKWQGEIWNRRKNGEAYAEWLSINSIVNKDGSPSRYVALFSDITKQKENEQLLWKQANFDELTGLMNRHMFNERLEHYILKSTKSSLKGALMMIDLDRFKEVNDSLGHDIGDTLLNEAAQRMAVCIPDTDLLGRLGGDEFIVLLGEMDDSRDAERIANNILKELSAPFPLNEETVYISASIGITIYPDDAKDTITLFKNADQAMYAAKNQGRNCFHYFTASMQEIAHARLRLTTDLHLALQENQFCVYYQPIVDLDTNKICKAEALIRWQHPVLGLISPASFIPLAEETGMIIPIGDWVFKEVVRQLSEWRSDINTFQISINRSPAQFRQKIQNEEWHTHLENADLPGESIVAEITEGLLADISINEKLATLRSYGIQVALDDFGTGYSSLSYLKNFDIDYLKIDSSFVRSLTPGSKDMALCEALIVMAHKLGIKVIAEGVETPKQRDLLMTARCDYGQGYFFSKPVPAAELEKLLKISKAESK